MASLVVLHLLHYDDDRGGVLTAIRLIARDRRVRHVLAVNRGFVQRREPVLECRPLLRLEAERLGVRSAIGALRVALTLAVQASPEEIFHGQSRAGLLVACWLWLLGHDCVVASPHSYGRQKWFYRWMAWCLGEKWRWLSPAMKRHYEAGHDWRDCLPEPLPPGLSLPPRPHDGLIVLGGAGNVVAWKRWDLVLEALALLNPQLRARFRFRHVGDADGSEESARYNRELRIRTQELGLDDVVEWRGWCGDMQAFWGGVDFAVISSEYEPMALAGLEALAAGRPLLLADSGGLHDVVEPGRNALVFRTGDAASLAQRLIELADAPAGRWRQVEPPAPRVDVPAAWGQLYESILRGRGTAI